jgi:hypothetical protein
MDNYLIVHIRRSQRDGMRDRRRREEAPASAGFGWMRSHSSGGAGGNGLGGYEVVGRYAGCY